MERRTFLRTSSLAGAISVSGMFTAYGKDCAQKHRPDRKKGPMIEHIVLVKLKQGVTEKQTNDLLNALTELKNRGSIPGFLEVAGGYNNSPEGRNKGFDFAFVLWFEDAEARDRYLPHPEHKELGGKYVGPIMEDLLVFDYEYVSQAF